MRSDIRLILTRHERTAGFMAATYGRLTGKPGVCLSTLGPGATNLVTPAAYTQLGAMPMIMITGQKPFKSSKQALADHGAPAPVMAADGGDCEVVVDKFAQACVSVDSPASGLQDEGPGPLVKYWNERAVIAPKTAASTLAP